MFLPAWRRHDDRRRVIAGHNLLDGVAASFGRSAALVDPARAGLRRCNTPDHVVFVAYPLIPWIGVTAVGYGLGQVYDWDAGPAAAFLLRLGTRADVAVRRASRGSTSTAIRRPGRSSRRPIFTVLSFLNTDKYPPSLLFLLMTLGPALLFLAGCRRRNAALAATGAGLRQGAAVLLPAAPAADPPARRRGLLRAVRRRALDVRVADLNSIRSRRRRDGVFRCRSSTRLDRLVVTLYPLCRWFAAVKARSGSRWLSYL